MSQERSTPREIQWDYIPKGLGVESVVNFVNEELAKSMNRLPLNQNSKPREEVYTSENLVVGTTIQGAGKSSKFHLRIHDYTSSGKGSALASKIQSLVEMRFGEQ